MLREIMRLADAIHADAVPGRAGPRRRNRATPGPTGSRDAGEPGRDEAAAGSAGDRRLLMVGGRTARGDWTWVAPGADAAGRAVPGPWSLTLLLRGRPAAGSSP